MMVVNLLKAVFLIAGTLAGLVCFWLLIEALFPGMAARARNRYEQSPWKSLLLGLVITLPVLVLGAGLGKAPAPAAKLLGAVLLALLLTAALIGLAGLARHIGCRLESSVDQNQPWRRVLRGGIVLAVACLTPVAGWFVVLPVVLVTGVGALALPAGKGSTAEVSPPPTAT